MIDKDALRREAEELKRKAESIQYLDDVVERRSNSGKRQNLVEEIKKVQVRYLQTPQAKVAWQGGTMQDELVKSVDGRLFPDQSSIVLYRDNYKGTPNWDTANERRLLVTECFQRIDVLKKEILEGKLDKLLNSHAEVLMHGVMGYEGELLGILRIDPKQGETYKRIAEGPASIIEAQGEKSLEDSYKVREQQGVVISWGINKIIKWLAKKRFESLKQASTSRPALVEEQKKSESPDIAEGTPEGGIFGVAVKTLTNEMASRMGLSKETHGTLVIEVFRDKLASKAGLRAGETPEVIPGKQVMLGGDVIVGVDGVPINDEDEFSQYFHLYHTKGTKITLSIIRNREPIELSIIY